MICCVSVNVVEFCLVFVMVLIDIILCIERKWDMLVSSFRLGKCLL